MGHTTNPDIRNAKSMVDYIFRWMGINFIAGYREAMTGMMKTEPAPAIAAPSTSGSATAATSNGTPSASAAEATIDASTSAPKATKPATDDAQPASAVATSTQPRQPSRLTRLPVQACVVVR